MCRRKFTLGICSGGIDNKQIVYQIENGGIFMKRRDGKNGFLNSALSGIVGVILTLIVEAIFPKKQELTINLSGKEITVTESTYTELVEKNNDLQEKISSLDAQLKELQNELDDKKSQEKIDEVIKNATEYWDKSEYIQALSNLKDCQLNSENIKVLYKKYSEEYCTYVLKEADELILGRKYDEANKILLDAQKLVDNSDALKNKLTELQSKEPVKLSDLKISASRNFKLNQNEPVEDSVGNRYSTGNLFIVKAEGKSGYGYATFYLGKKYTHMSGSIAVSDESENRNDTQLEGWIEIYSKTEDEYTNLYTSPILSRMTSPITIPEIDLKDSDWVEIRYYNNGEYFNLTAGYHSLEVLLSDFMLYSD